MPSETTRIMPRRIDPERLKEGQLKELAARLNRLPYRDMLAFAEQVTERIVTDTKKALEGTDLSAVPSPAYILADALLDWADKLGATT